MAGVLVTSYYFFPNVRATCIRLLPDNWSRLPFVHVYVLLQLWVQSSHHVVNFSIKCFRIYKTTHRMWLRILSIALEKELKVLNWA